MFATASRIEIQPGGRPLEFPLPLAGGVVGLRGGVGADGVGAGALGAGAGVRGSSGERGASRVGPPNGLTCRSNTVPGSSVIGGCGLLSNPLSYPPPLSSKEMRAIALCLSAAEHGAYGVLDRGT